MNISIQLESMSTIAARLISENTWRTLFQWALLLFLRWIGPGIKIGRLYPLASPSHPERWARKKDIPWLIFRVVTDSPSPIQLQYVLPPPVRFCYFFQKLMPIYAIGQDNNWNFLHWNFVQNTGLLINHMWLIKRPVFCTKFQCKKFQLLSWPIAYIGISFWKK